MKKEFYQQLFLKQQGIQAVPPNDMITGWVKKLIHLLYPEQVGNNYTSAGEIEKALQTSHCLLAAYWLLFIFTHTSLPFLKGIHRLAYGPSRLPS